MWSFRILTGSPFRTSHRSVTWGEMIVHQPAGARVRESQSQRQREVAPRWFNICGRYLNNHEIQDDNFYDHVRRCRRADYRFWWPWPVYGRLHSTDELQPPSPELLDGSDDPNTRPNREISFLMLGWESPGFDTFPSAIATAPGVTDLTPVGALQSFSFSRAHFPAFWHSSGHSRKSFRSMTKLVRVFGVQLTPRRPSSTIKMIKLALESCRLPAPGAVWNWNMCGIAALLCGAKLEPSGEHRARRRTSAVTTQEFKWATSPACGRNDRKAKEQTVSLHSLYAIPRQKPVGDRSLRVLWALFMQILAHTTAC